MDAREMDESLRALGGLIHAVDRRLDGEATARSLAQSAGVVRSVYELSADDLLLHPGLSRPAAEAVDLIDDLGRLMALEAFGRRPVFHRATEAAAYFSALMLGRRVEYCYLLCLDARGRMLRCELLQRGTIDRSAVYMRDVALAALRAEAKYAVLTHNHPGGSTEPSPADIEVTRGAMEALRLVNTVFVDHIIVTDREPASIRAAGYIPEKRWLLQKPGDRFLTGWLKGMQ